MNKVKFSFVFVFILLLTIQLQIVFSAGFTSAESEKSKVRFKIKEIKPNKISIERGGKGKSVKLIGSKLLLIKGVSVMKVKGKKRLKSKVNAFLIKRGTTSNRRFVRLEAEKNAALGKKYVLRLFEKKVKRKAVFLDVPFKVLTIKVVALKRSASIAKKEKPITPVIAVKPVPARVTSSPALDVKIYSLSKRSLQIGTDEKPEIIVVNGRNLKQATSAQVLINNQVAKDIKVELGKASESSLKIKITALSKAKLGKNYQLRLLAGEKIIDIPTSKFRMDIYLSQKSSKTKLKMSKAKMTTKQSIKAVSQTTTAQSAVKPWELPDLIITPCEVRYMLHGCASDPSGKFMIYWKVKNQGFKPAFFEHNQRIVKWWRTDPEGNATGSLTGGGWVEYAPSTGLMIMPGDEYVATSYDWFCVVGSKVGTYTYTYYTDPNGKVLESNENNNQRTCTFEITSDMFPYVPSYDLTIIAASAIPSSGPAETTYFASQITVKNIGDDQAPEAYVYGIGGLVSVKALAPGESITVTTTPLTYLMPPGQKTIECKVESKDRSMRDKDKDTTNNTKSVTFQVTSGGE